MEEPLPAGGSCLLGSLNLSEFVKVNKAGESYLDKEDLEQAVEIAVEALNEVLEEGLPLHPLSEQQNSVRDWRQIGLGIMGLGDMLIKLGLRYGSPEAVEACECLGQLIAETALLTSAHLAEEKGQFPKCNIEEIAGTEYFAENVKDPAAYQYIIKHGLRNSQLLTIAPTGTLSTMLGISGGIEPIFANYYMRKTESLHGDTVYYKVYTPIVQKYLNEHPGITDEDLPNYFVTAADLDYKERIAMQAAWQKHIDASISSTVNVPKDFTVQDTFNLYMEAWKQGLKGVTIYREGCKRDAVLSAVSDQAALTATNADQSAAAENNLKRGEIIPANDNSLIGLKRKLTTGCGSLHCEAYFDPDTNELREIFLSKGSTGGCLNSLTGISRLISVAVRGGVSLEAIVDQLMSTGSCPSYTARAQNKHDTSKGSCCPMAVGYALLDMQKQFVGMNSNGTVQIEPINPVETRTVSAGPTCPNCGEHLYFEGGCNICKACGWTKCD